MIKSCSDYIIINYKFWESFDWRVRRCGRRHRRCRWEGGGRVQRGGRKLFKLAAWQHGEGATKGISLLDKEFLELFWRMFECMFFEFLWYLSSIFVWFHCLFIIYLIFGQPGGHGAALLQPRAGDASHRGDEEHVSRGATSVEVPGDENTASIMYRSSYTTIDHYCCVKNIDL